MSKYILLRDRNHCPACQRPAVPNSIPAKCRSCGMQLFKFTDNLTKWEAETGWREYWVWTGSEFGWKHRSHVMGEGAKALTRSYEIPKLPDDYGTPEYQTRRLNETRSELQEAMRKTKPKGKIVKASPSADTATAKESKV